MDKFETVLPKLLKIELFSDFKADNPRDCQILKLVYENMSLKNYKAGDVIIKEGDFGDLFFILYKGSVKVMRNTPAGDVIALANLNSDMNIFFGETALISNDARTATVQASTDCTTIALSSKKFLQICDKEPLLGYRVILHLARRMSQTIRNTNSDKAALYEALFNEIESQ
ncbi:MAG: cyclic nucleotide-binding domain-containing protein [Treponema sp.]|mgnify:FL=1|nr:cyclic nucleotide-binding domain-containing protein [Treponema sp.]